MTEPIIMGLKVEPRITYPSQSNRGTQGHHNPYPVDPEKWAVNWRSLPLKTAEEMANYLMESTVKKQHFNSEIPTVGGRIKTVRISPGGEIHEHVSES